MSDHFDGKKYYNPFASGRNLRELFSWLWKRKPTVWPSHVPVEPQKIKHERVKLGELWVTFIGHSTVLIQIDGWNILTDPIWSERASPFSFMGPKRVSPPGILFENLPPIDLVLVSHNHYDHMDLPTLQQLERVYKPQFIVCKGNQVYLQKYGITRVFELDWWDELPIKGALALHCVPAQHFSARTPFDKNQSLWGGFFIKGYNHKIYFAGDTGYGPHFKKIQERLGSPDLALIPIGAFKPEWFMHPMHLSPKDAIYAYKDIQAKKAIGIHFGAFQLSDEAFDEPVQELCKELQKDPFIQFTTLKPGEGQKID